MKPKLQKSSGKVRWQSPSNIALVKYWGKYGRQLPRNPSLSFTLKKSYTDTIVKYQYRPKQKSVSFGLKFMGKSNQKFAEKIGIYLKSIQNDFKFLKNYHLEIESINTFPHSAGIASSAAFYSSLALCLCSMDEKINPPKKHQPDKFYQRASYYARLGSGSACRSVYGGPALWGKIKGINNSSDNYAIPLKSSKLAGYQNYCDTILIVSSAEKKISSSAGHSLMEKNPYARIRFKDAKENATKIIQAMQKNNHQEFRSIVEREALSLHAMMMTSHPSFILMEANTINIINKIREYRERTKANICFTLDAGPNVHVLYPHSEKGKIKKFIFANLLKYCEDRKYIDDEVGEGPKEIVK